MRTVDPLRQPDGATTHRSVVPPFLPTLGLALVAGLLSFVCHEPAEAPNVAPERPPVLSLAPGLSPFDPGRALLTAELDPVPASEAFARLTPLVTGSIEPPPPLPARPASPTPAGPSAARRRRAGSPWPPPRRPAAGGDADGRETGLITLALRRGRGRERPLPAPRCAALRRHGGRRARHRPRLG